MLLSGKSLEIVGEDTVGGGFYGCGNMVLMYEVRVDVRDLNLVSEVALVETKMTETTLTRKSLSKTAL